MMVTVGHTEQSSRSVPWCSYTSMETVSVPPFAQRALRVEPHALSPNPIGSRDRSQPPSFFELFSKRASDVG